MAFNWVLYLLSFLFARHAKALFLAMDHYFDPHLKPGGNASASHGAGPIDEDEHEHPSQS